MLQKHNFLSFLLALVALLLVRFAFCSLHAPFKNSLWPDSRALFASSAPSAKTTACNTLTFLWISYASCCFLHLFLAFHTLLFHVLLIFVKNASRPRCGAWFWKPHSCKIMLKKAFQVPRSHGLRSFWSCLWHLEFAKSMGKMCIFCLWTLFGSFLCRYVFYRMHFGWHFHIFAMLSSPFCWKVDPALRSHIAQICKANCKICRRMHIAMISSS